MAFSPHGLEEIAVEERLARGAASQGDDAVQPTVGAFFAGISRGPGFESLGDSVHRLPGSDREIASEQRAPAARLHSQPAPPRSVALLIRNRQKSSGNCSRSCRRLASSPPKFGPRPPPHPLPADCPPH